MGKIQTALTSMDSHASIWQLADVIASRACRIYLIVGFGTLFAQ